jgi:hypothetical protein
VTPLADSGQRCADLKPRRESRCGKKCAEQERNDADELRNARSRRNKMFVVDDDSGIESSGHGHATTFPA